MKSIHIALAVSFLLAGIPTVLAEGNCSTRPPNEASMSHPARPNSYLVLDPSKPDKIGEWTEMNGVSGLQTFTCFHFGIHRYNADAKSAVLP